MKNLLRASLRRYSVEEIGAIYRPIVAKMIELTEPLKIILFGSAIDGRFDECSDLDFLIVFMDGDDILKKQSQLYRLNGDFKQLMDFICVPQSRYEKMKNLGGVIYVAEHEGRVLHNVLQSS